MEHQRRAVAELRKELENIVADTPQSMLQIVRTKCKATLRKMQAILDRGESTEILCELGDLALCIVDNELVVAKHAPGDTRQQFGIDDQNNITAFPNRKMGRCGNRIVLDDASESCWRFDDGIIRLVGTDLCFDIEDGQISEGAPIIAYSYSNSPNQKWELAV